MLICGSSQGEYGGIEAVMLTLADYLQTNTPIRCMLALKLVRGATLSNTLRGFLEQNPVQYAVVGKLDRKLLKLILWADVIHTQNVPPDIVFLAKLLGKPIISTTHNYRSSRFSPHNLLWKLGNLLCDSVTFNSRFVSKTWKTAPSYNRRFRVIPTVSHLPKFQETSSPRSGFVFIARWIPNKGADLLIKAYEKADINKEQWPLIMMGDGPLRNELEQVVRERSIQGITILGRVTESDKFNRIASAKWIVVPPNTREDMGLTPIEGRALGTPAIASLDGGIPESAGDQAIFFPAGDVDALTASLESVAHMPEVEYYSRATLTRTSLADYLQPQSVYVDLYREHLGSGLITDPVV